MLKEGKFPFICEMELDLRGRIRVNERILQVCQGEVKSGGGAQKALHQLLTRLYIVCRASLVLLGPEPKRHVARMSRSRPPIVQHKTAPQNWLKLLLSRLKVSEKCVALTVGILRFGMAMRERRAATCQKRHALGNLVRNKRHAARAPTSGQKLEMYHLPWPLAYPAQREA